MQESDVPLYHQIYLHLRAEILDGSWVGRDNFPGEVELAEQFDVSVATSRKALDRLVEDGFIARGRGRRPQVLRGPEARRKQPPPAVIQTYPGPRRDFTYRVLSKGIKVAPIEACESFEVPPGTQLWHCTRLRSYEDHPHSVTLNVQLPERGRTWSAADLQRYPLAHLLRKNGVKLSRIRRRITAALPPPQVSAPLGLLLNEPTLIYTFTHYDVDNAPVQWTRIWVRHDEPSPEEDFCYDKDSWSMTGFK